MDRGEHKDLPTMDLLYVLLTVYLMAAAGFAWVCFGPTGASEHTLARRRGGR